MCVATVEMALLDLLGQISGAAIGDLLGGVRRRDIAVYRASGNRGNTPEQEVEYLKRLVAETGARAIKFRLGGRMSRNADSPPGRSEALIPLVRQAFGGAMTLYADANSSYDASHAIRLGRLLEQHNYAMFEEPCEFDDLWATKQVSDALNIPVGLGEQEFSLRRFQWVIENRFVAPRPAWEEAGAGIAADVAPFETMKLRLLNGSHSTLAYLGYLAGHATIAQAAGDPLLGRLVARQMAEEIVPTLASPPGTDLAHYCATLLVRFRNPALPHRTAQVAMDGSQKLPQRLLGTVRDRLAGGGSIRHLTLAVAGWMRYAGGVDEHGARIDVADPLAARYAEIAAAAHGDPAALAHGFLAITAIFGEDLPAKPAFADAVTRHLASLVRRGVAATLADHLAHD